MRCKSFADLVGRFPNLRIASESEGRELAEFAKAQGMKVKNGGVGFDRGEDFFSLFRVYTDQYWVVTILNDDRSLVGVMAFSRQRMRVAGELRWVAYLGDLRLDPKACKNARKQWREFYIAFISYLEDPEAPEHCDHLIAAILQENERALHVFKNELKSVVFHEIRPYWTLSVFHPFSWRRPLSLLSSRRSRLSVNDAEVREVESLRSSSLTMERLPEGAEFRPLIVRDVDEQPVAGTALWDGRRARMLRVFNLPRHLRWIFRSLSVLSAVDYSEAHPWVMKCLSSLALAPSVSFERRLEAMTELVDFCFREKRRDFHLLNMTLMDRELCRALQRRFPVSKVTAGWLFEITTPGKSPALRDQEVAFDGSFL